MCWQVKEDLKRNYVPLILEGGVWPVVLVFNFRCVPVKCFLDSAFLSCLEQQKGAPLKKWFASFHSTITNEKGGGHWWRRDWWNNKNWFLKAFEYFLFFNVLQVVIDRLKIDILLCILLLSLIILNCRPRNYLRATSWELQLLAYSGTEDKYNLISL